MPTLTLESFLPVPVERAFDLARDVDLHCRSLAHTGERAVAGRTTGLLGAGDTVTWEARHLGVRWRMTVRITRFEPPHAFVDEQVRGPFARLVHAHRFEPAPGGTRITDMLEFAAPLGPLGRLAERWLLAAHLERLLRERNRFLERHAGS